jgi:hypothetical protein
MGVTGITLSEDVLFARVLEKVRAVVRISDRRTTTTTNTNP